MVSSLARWTQRLGAAGLVLAILGPLNASLGIVAPFVGFLPLLGGLVLSLVAVLLGMIVLIRGPGGSRGVAGRGLVVGLLVIGGVVAGAGAGLGAPRINDITTDTTNPPRFVQAAMIAANRGRDMTYPGETVARQQRQGYGPIAPLPLAMPADQAWATVLATARHMEGWEITREDPEMRTLEGIEQSRLFRFRDDFVIEVREGDGQSIVHMRSKSRDGQSDLGVNAARIRGFLARVAAQ